MAFPTFKSLPALLLGAVCLAACFVLWPGTEGLAEQRAMWLAGGFAVLAACFSGLRHTPVAPPLPR